MRQIIWRLYYKLPLGAVSFPHRQNKKIIFVPSQPKIKFIDPIQSLITTNPCVFRFLNEEKAIENLSDWNTVYESKLWIYNLHYHSFLLENCPIDYKVAILNRWIEENPRPHGCGWAPYPLSLRIVNWVKFFLTFPSQVNEKLIHSLVEQCEALFCQIEYHILGNHLFENAKALVIAGLVLKGKRSQKFLMTGIKILSHELNEQILSDGGHFERSPMYHCIILEGILDLYHLISLYPEVENKEIVGLKQLLNLKIPAMLSALQVICHEDGKIAFFNDSTLEIAAHPDSLRVYAANLGFSSSSPETNFLEDIGFIKLKSSHFSLIVDTGNIAPSYLPAHAHAESLSFECSFLNERLFVNVGVSTYDNNNKRAYQRSTIAHNCVAFNGNKNTAEIWGSFRVGKRPIVNNMTVHLKTKVLLELTRIPHLPKKFIHTRELTLENDELQIHDVFDESKKNFKSMKKSNLTKEVHYHLHPNWKIKEFFEEKIILVSIKTAAEIKINFQADNEITYEIKDYKYASGFNQEINGHKIIFYCSRLTKSFQFRVYI